MFKVGFYFNGVENNHDINTIQASTRIRVFDVIKMFKYDFKYRLELFKPGKKYDLVVFQKILDKKGLDLLKETKNLGCKTVYDININAIDCDWDSDSLFGSGTKEVLVERAEIIKSICSEADIVCVSSRHLKGVYSQYSKRTICIEESVPDSLIDLSREINRVNPLSMVYCGYSLKAKELLLISNAIKEMQSEHGAKMYCVCEAPPEGLDFSFEFVKYNQSKIIEQLSAFDIKLAPRDLYNGYNLGHAATKVALPVVAGVVAIGSNIPSYINRIETLDNNPLNWLNLLKTLNSDRSLMEHMLFSQYESVRANLSGKKIKADYKRMFEYIFS